MTFTTSKITAPTPHTGRVFQDKYDQLAEQVRQCPTGEALRLEVPEGKKPTIFRNNAMQALRRRGIAVQSKALEGGKAYAIWI